MMEARGHPDDAENSKLRWLKEVDRHLDLDDPHCFIWFDYFSVPQHPKNIFHALLAVRSIPCYINITRFFVPLVKGNDRSDFVARYDGTAEVKAAAEADPVLSKGEYSGIEQYLERGWCRTELFVALCPKKYPQGKWVKGLPVGFYAYNRKPHAKQRVTAKANPRSLWKKATVLMVPDKLDLTDHLQLYTINFDHLEHGQNHRVTEGLIRPPAFLRNAKAEDLHDPATGKWTKDGDRDAVEQHLMPVVALMYSEYYDKMNRTNMHDGCIRVHDRPPWLLLLEEELKEEMNDGPKIIRATQFTHPGADKAAEMVTRRSSLVRGHPALTIACRSFGGARFSCGRGASKTRPAHSPLLCSSHLPNQSHSSGWACFLRCEACPNSGHIFSN